MRLTNSRLIFVAVASALLFLAAYRGRSQATQRVDNLQGCELAISYRLGGFASRTTAPCVSLITSSESFFTKSKSLVFSDE